MVVNRLQNGSINSRIAPRASRLNCQNIFFQMGLHTFFSDSDRDFNSESNNVSQVQSDQQESKSEQALQIIGHVVAESYTNKRSKHGRRQFVVSNASL
jgi:hypothetical protein